MTELIFYRGNEPITVKQSNEVCYLYRIGSGQVEGRQFIDLNDSDQLNALAEQNRDEYTHWVYSLNENFLASDLIIDDLSLFFLTDLSCKRSEFFETFDLLCSLLLIQKRLAGVDLKKACLIGFESSFVTTFKSIFPKVTVTTRKEVQPRVRVSRRLTSDGIYLLRLLAVLTYNRIVKHRIHFAECAERVFFSYYPQIFSKSGGDTKYGTFVEEKDQYVVSIMTDGMHQRTSVANYIAWSREAENNGFAVIDRYLEWPDLLNGLYWLGRMWLFYLKEKSRTYLFKTVDISSLIRVELIFSISRIMRLCVLKGPLRRFIQKNQFTELVYYPCEYPIGRLISWVSKTEAPSMVRTGFQMGIVSRRRLEQYLATEEAAQAPPFLKHAPIPDRILAEDAAAASIYRRSGYQNVQIMETVYRFGYLEGIETKKKSDLILIAPGLHDGATMLEQLRSEIENNPSTNYLVKPHPRADNQYLDQWSCIQNLSITVLDIEELLASVSRVFVSYSSVGVEARRLGLDVTVIDVPGRINTSPLLDT